MAGESNNKNPEAVSSQPAQVDKDSGERNRVRAAALDERGITDTPLPEQLSDRKKIDVSPSEKDITDLLTADSRKKIWEMAEKNIDKNGKEYKDNDNLGPDKCTIARQTVKVGDTYKAVINVYVIGNSKAVIMQQLEMGTFDMDNNIAFREELRKDPPLNDGSRTEINQSFKT
jgi:hypothetical protein